MRSCQLLCIALVVVACGKDSGNKGSGSAASKPATPEPAPTPAAPTPAAPQPDMGFCEYTIDGGEPNRGGGGVMNVQSLHWMPADQKGRSLAVHLLINCGPSGKQINISANDGKDTDYPIGVKKFPIESSNGPGTFSVMGTGIGGASKGGELDITAWDKSHVAGSFKFTSGGKAVAGTFDLKCPTPGNGICE